MKDENSYEKMILERAYMLINPLNMPEKEEEENAKPN